MMIDKIIYKIIAGLYYSNFVRIFLGVCILLYIGLGVITV